MNRQTEHRIGRGTAAVADDASREADEVRHDLERTRERLGDTVQELAHKVNVPARARERAGKAATKVRRTVPDPVASGAGKLAGTARHHPLPTAGVLALLLALVGALIWWLNGR